MLTAPTFVTKAGSYTFNPDEAMTPEMYLSAIKAAYANQPGTDAICYDLERAFSLGHEFGIERAASVVDQCNREGPYNAIGAASRIRALMVETVKPAATIDEDFLYTARGNVMASPMPTLAAPRSAQTLNPFTAGEVAVNAGNRGVVAVEQQRAITEVQARMIIARANPRDPIRAMEKILNDCTRPTLADHAIYQYARGGTDIRGPSIRLAEAIAQRWGNIASGIKEMSRSGEYSECIAYAWDLESGYYDERQFQVRHWRDTRQGGYQLTRRARHLRAHRQFRPASQARGPPDRHPRRRHRGRA